MNDDPFSDLKIDTSDFLDDIKDRSPCPRCQKSRKYYCYTCYVPVTGLEGRLPRVKLPLKVDVIKHPGEVDGKSTAPHAAVLAPDDVTIHTYPNIPEFADTDRVVLVFPCKDSLTLEQYAEQYCPLVNEKSDSEHQGEAAFKDKTTGPTHCGVHEGKSVKKHTQLMTEEHESRACEVKTSPECLKHVKRRDVCEETETVANKKQKTNATERQDRGIDRVVFIDSTWTQTKQILKDDRLNALKKVELTSRVTKFWRQQRDKPDTYLATIEAVYYFLRDYHLCFVDSTYSGQFDNMLFLFSYLYRKIHQTHPECASGGPVWRETKSRHKSRLTNS